ncbi:MAG: hypothetical protein JRG89_09370 [Deltaproteobacteria bacterium]|nr:hypothetical protein [Deltaproteobacteria bacterium]
MRSPDQEVQIERPILTVFKGSEAVEDEGLAGCTAWPTLLMEEQAVAPKAFGLTLQGTVRDAEFAADLPKTGATDKAMEKGFEELGVSQPVGGGEGLGTEVPVALMTLVPLNEMRTMGAAKEALLLVAPRA